MSQTIKKYLNDSFAARWTALVLVASMMFFAYMFVDVLSPLSTLLESTKGWTAETSSSSQVSSLTRWESASLVFFPVL